MSLSFAGVNLRMGRGQIERKLRYAPCNQTTELGISFLTQPGSKILKHKWHSFGFHNEREFLIGKLFVNDRHL